MPTPLSDTSRFLLYGLPSGTPATTPVLTPLSNYCPVAHEWYLVMVSFHPEFDTIDAQGHLATQASQTCS